MEVRESQYIRLSDHGSDLKNFDRSHFSLDFVNQTIIIAAS
jgi:hypothetical protein